jgi:catechol 2,3-dioxygenase-like lactoylglutathione lyase family enzyme
VTGSFSFDSRSVHQYQLVKQVIMKTKKKKAPSPNRKPDRKRLKRTVSGAANTIRISQVGTVFIPVGDQDLALEFYLDKLGFEKRADFPYGESSRWIEVAPPGAINTISLVPPSEGKSAGGDQTHCAFATMDIEADHATLRARGVDVDAEIARRGKRRAGLVSVAASVPNPVPSQFFFRDLDGNRFLIVQPD